MEDNFEIPANSAYLDSKKKQAKDRLATVFDEYKELLKDKTHPSIQTPAYKKKTMGVLQRLLTAADELDSVNPGEGIFGLIVLSLRTNLALKDEIVKLERELKYAKREVDKLKKRK